MSDKNSTIFPAVQQLVSSFPRYVKTVKRGRYTVANMAVLTFFNSVLLI